MSSLHVPALKPWWAWTGRGTPSSGIGALGQELWEDLDLEAQVDFFGLAGPP